MTAMSSADFESVNAVAPPLEESKGGLFVRVATVFLSVHAPLESRLLAPLPDELEGSSRDATNPPPM